MPKPITKVSPMSPEWPRAHLMARLNQLENEYIGSWPKWNNDDLVALGALLREIQPEPKP